MIPEVMKRKMKIESDNHSLFNKQQTDKLVNKKHNRSFVKMSVIKSRLGKHIVRGKCAMCDCDDVIITNTHFKLCNMCERWVRRKVYVKYGYTSITHYKEMVSEFCKPMKCWNYEVCKSYISKMKNGKIIGGNTAAFCPSCENIYYHLKAQMHAGRSKKMYMSRKAMTEEMNKRNKIQEQTGREFFR